jgi:hypothetical protein
VLPVKEIFLIMGWVARIFPTVEELPVVITLMTPLGTPASSASYNEPSPVALSPLTLARASAEKGVSEGALMTQVQPAAKAAATFRVIIAEGTDCQSVLQTVPLTVPGGDDAHHSDGLLDRDVADAIDGRGDVVTVRSHSLGCEPGG